MKSRYYFFAFAVFVLFFVFFVFFSSASRAQGQRAQSYANYLQSGQYHAALASRQYIGGEDEYNERCEPVAYDNYDPEYQPATDHNYTEASAAVAYNQCDWKYYGQIAASTAKAA